VSRVFPYILTVQIAEGGGYMRDYVEDEKGRIARVDFDFVREK